MSNLPAAPPQSPGCVAGRAAGRGLAGAPAPGAGVRPRPVLIFCQISAERPDGAERRHNHAAVLVIGDEILSGRTQDKNLGYIADYLAELGIDLREVRVVPDVEAEIVAALNALRARYTYVFTTGGIGPTHDDITADAVAKAFGVGIARTSAPSRCCWSASRAPRAEPGAPAHGAHPAGADLIDNPISKAPGFMIGNVIVMAGVPVDHAGHARRGRAGLINGAKVHVASLDARDFPEGPTPPTRGDRRAHRARHRRHLSLLHQRRLRNQIVLRSRDAERARSSDAGGARADRAPPRPNERSTRTDA